QVTVRKVWGQPMGNKVTLKVTRHQGSSKEAVEWHTLTLDQNGQAALKVQLADGRRTQSESVPVTATVKRLPVHGQSADEVYAVLRAMSDPMLSLNRTVVKGGTSATGGVTETARATLGLEPGVELSHQTKVSPALSSGVDLLTQ